MTAKKVQITSDPEGPGDLVGAAEASEIVGVERNRIPRWRKKGAMPDPVAVLKATPVWLRGDIEELADEYQAAKAKREEKRKEGTNGR